MLLDAPLHHSPLALVTNDLFSCLDSWIHNIPAAFDSVSHFWHINNWKGSITNKWKFKANRFQVFRWVLLNLSIAKLKLYPMQRRQSWISQINNPWRSTRVSLFIRGRKLNLVYICLLQPEKKVISIFIWVFFYFIILLSQAKTTLSMMSK